MDAFIGASPNGKNRGLLDRLWQRLYGAEIPEGLIRTVDCTLCKDCCPKDHFFDLRMGVKLNEDRWAVEANANYKMETLFKGSYFDFQMAVDDHQLSKGQNQDKLFLLVKELTDGKFWFGAGKTKGLGRCRLELNVPLPAPTTATLQLSPQVNSLRMHIDLLAENPLLVSWNWGKVSDAGYTVAGVSDQAWREFMASHARVSYRDMTHRKNLAKSITNDT